MSKTSVAVVAKPGAPSSLIPEKQQRGVATLSQTLATAKAEMIDAGSDDFRKGLIQAKAMRMLEEQLTPEVMSDVMYLRGSEIGFITDRDWKPVNQQYSVAEVKTPLIVALLTGLRPTGNEFNIIAGKCYQTVRGLCRIVAEWPGLTDLRFDLGVPSSSEKGALVPVVATWKLDGKPMNLACDKTDKHDRRIPVKVNDKMGIDAIHGKAKRKMYSRIRERLDGSIHSLPIVGDDDPSDLTIEVDKPLGPEDPSDAMESFDAREHATMPAEKPRKKRRTKLAKKDKPVKDDVPPLVAIDSWASAERSKLESAYDDGDIVDAIYAKLQLLGQQAGETEVRGLMRSCWDRAHKIHGEDLAEQVFADITMQGDARLAELDAGRGEKSTKQGKLI